MKTKLSVTRIANWISLLLILAMIVMTFLPCWTYETKEKVEIDGKKQNITVTKEVSISEYVWFLREHKDLTSEFEDAYEDAYDEELFVNDMITAPALLLALGIALGILSLWHQTLPLGSALAAVLGIITGIGYSGWRVYAMAPLLDTVILVSFVVAGVAALLLAGSVVELVLPKVKKAKAA